MGNVCTLQFQFLIHNQLNRQSVFRIQNGWYWGHNSVIMVIQEKKKSCLIEKKKQRKFWVRPIFRERKLKGEFHTLIQDLKLFDLFECFFKQFSITPTKLEELLSWVALKIEKSSVRHEPICAEQRLCVTLCHLVTGDAHVSIAAGYRISPTSIGRIIKETTGTIWDVLLEKGFTTTTVIERLGEHIQRFWKQMELPHCVGALDGKHVVLPGTCKE